MPKSKETAKPAETTKVAAKAQKSSKKTEKAEQKPEPVKVESKVEPVAAAKKAPKVAGEKKEKKGKRSFRAVYENPDGDVVMGGRYCGAKPKQAGCKALTAIYKLFAEAGKKMKGPIFFGVRETTRSSRNKTYYYSGERIVLKDPVKLQIGGGNGTAAKTITYKYNSVVKKASEEDCEHLSNPIELADEDEEVDVAVAPAKQSKQSKAPKAKESKEAKVEKTDKAEKSEKKTKKSN